MKTHLLFLLVFCISLNVRGQKVYELQSPNGEIKAIGVYKMIIRNH